MQIRSEIEDLITFLITSSGFLKLIKCFPSMYVSTETAILFALSKKISSFKFSEPLDLFVSLEKYLLIN